MRFQEFIGGLALASSIAASGLASPVVDAPTRHVQFHSSSFQAGLRYVNDSGVCETTPGVHTASGYIDIAQNQSLVSSSLAFCGPLRLDADASAVVLVLRSTREPGDCAVHALVRYVF